MDAHAFAAEVAVEYPKLVRSVALFCGDRHVAEDAVQEAMARAWERLDRGEVIDSLAGWVVVVASNQTRSVARREARRLKHLLTRAPAEVPDSAPGVAETDAVRAAIRRLPNRQREVVVLHYYLDLPIQEIAGLLHLSDGAVKNALHNARTRLADALGTPDSEDEHVRS
jgi:RNA polymerase sigma-70 factor (ECF subfamily)